MKGRVVLWDPSEASASGKGNGGRGAGAAHPVLDRVEERGRGFDGRTHVRQRSPWVSNGYPFRVHEVGPARGTVGTIIDGSLTDRVRSRVVRGCPCGPGLGSGREVPVFALWWGQDAWAWTASCRDRLRSSGLSRMGLLGPGWVSLGTPAVACRVPFSERTQSSVMIQVKAMGTR